jgi:threonine/homoserine/homoserine lactone efflux protein
MGRREKLPPIRHRRSAKGFTMPPANILATFFAAALLLALAPGPDNLFVLTQSATGGKGAGLTVTLGLCTGLIGHTLAVVLGVAALVRASALAFTGLKLLGAGYLLYLAWQAFRAPAASLAVTAASPGFARLYRRGIFMNLTNPKVSLFFLAFLPQFADPGRGPVAPQLLLLGGLFIIATLLVFGAIALLAGTLGERLNRSPGLQRLLNRLAATVFFGLALHLVSSRN